MTGRGAPLDGPARHGTLPPMRALLLVLLLAAPAASAADCADPPDRRAEKDALFSALVSAPDPVRGRIATLAIWRFWFTAPDALAQDLLDRGGLAIRASDLRTAEAAFAALIAHCPAYAEGWNQRALARFLAGNLAGSLADIDETLAREPAHFGALSGKAQILRRQGRDGEADRTLARALAINPWLAERILPLPGVPL